MICKHCGAEFCAKGKEALYCSYRCTRNAAHLRKTIREGRTPGGFVSSLIMCTVCGVEFMSRGAGQLYCSRLCGKRAKGAPARACKLQVKQTKAEAKVATLQLRVEARALKAQTQLQARESAEALRQSAGLMKLNLGRCHPATLRGHGVTEEWYIRTLIEQGGCAACGSKIGPWEIDHDHRHCSGPTGCPECVKGILCSPCNHAAGSVLDNSNHLGLVVDYLERTGR